uniref:NADH dehydrogenase subunit 2 n=1 Tax=Cucullanus robustus TaxID=657293 RepID=G4V247_9BILA|nr:NADH dehydrogenase subunit 2 [Cucullanus robustus]ACV96764.1 NADH dehydrogenase subunit 2 [Cucullanus robustus]
MFFIFIYVFLLSLVNMITTNFLVWWSVFLMMTLSFLVLLKVDSSYSSMLNYFIIQESLGLMFLLFNVGCVQFLVLLVKVGVSPLHFWVFSIVNGLMNWNLVWFLTFQKIPFIPVIIQLLNYGYLVFIMMGILFVYLQLFLSKNMKNMFVLSSLESFNWILLLCFLSMLNFLFLFFFYVLVMIFLMNSVLSGGGLLLEWDTVLVFMNIPFGVIFFVKIFSLSSLFLLFSVFFLFVLVLMFMSLVSFSYWLFFVSMITPKSVSVVMDYFFFFVYPLGLLMLL